MSTPLTTLISDIRVLSGLRQNQLYTDPQIAAMVSDLWQELYDRFVAAQQHYSITTLDFTLTGGVGNNTVPLPANFYQGNGLVLNPTQDRPQIVPYASAWLTRFNQGASVLSGPAYASCPDGRRYDFSGSTLEVLPPSLSAGDYRLYYTPQCDRLEAGIDQDFDIESADNATNHSGFVEWVLANANFTESMVGGTLTLDLDAPNDALWNGSYTITEVLSSTAVVTDTPTPVGSFTNPAAGTANITFQPVGTTDELPDYADPWAIYIKLGTSIAIREARQQDVSDLTRRYEQQAARVSMALQNRQEEATQPPLTRGLSFWDLI